MFWAVTRPEPDAATDFGEMFPVRTARSVRRARSEGGVRVVGRERRACVARRAVSGRWALVGAAARGAPGSWDEPELSAVTIKAIATAKPSVMASPAALLVSSLITRSVSAPTRHYLGAGYARKPLRFRRVGFRQPGSGPRTRRFRTGKPCRLRDSFSTPCRAGQRARRTPCRQPWKKWLSKFVLTLRCITMHTQYSYRRKKGGQCCVTAFRSWRTGLSVPAQTAARRSVGLIATPGPSAV